MGLKEMRTRAWAKARDVAPWVDGPRARNAGSFLKDVYSEFQRDDVSIWAGALAYRFFLALFPFFIFLAAASGFVAALVGITDPTADMVELLGKVLPAEASRVIGEQLGDVLGARSIGLLSVGLLAALWAASSGVVAVMRAMNKAYDIEESRPLWKKYPMALGLTVLGGLFVLVGTLLFFTGQFFMSDILRWMGIEAGWLHALIGWSRWVLLVLVLMLGVSFVYWASPNATLSFPLVVPGAVLFVVVWLAATWGFSVYVANFGNYGATYGTLGGVVVLLAWMYVTSLLLLVGAEVNAVVMERREPALLRRERMEAHAEAEALARGKEEEGAGREP